jgi:hypothetical protein
MRFPSRPAPLAPLAAIAVVLAGATCAFPTDKSDQVTVVIQAPKVVVIRGQQLPLVARAFRVIGSDTQDVQNVVFQWISTNPTLATVQDDGSGSAQVTGVNSGTVQITARATAFDQADMGSVQVRVSNPLEIDSVRPSLVRFGDTITVYGVGVDSIFLAFLDDVTQFDYPLPGLVATRTRDSLGFATATFWVTPPARTSPLSFFGPGVFGNAPDTTRVVPFDVLEPNEVAPRTINLDAAPRFPLIPQIKFLNPALAFEIPRRDETGVEWYRFTQSAPRDLTLILSGPDVRGTFSTFLTNQLTFNAADTSYAIGPTSWTIGPGSHFCQGFAFAPPQTQPESTIVALRAMPGPLHALALYNQPGRYGLAVFEGYVTSDPTVPRDAHEEDDFCDAGDARGLAATLPGGLGFRATLTIDNPHDVDWIRFRVASLSNVTIKIASVPGATSDTSDVDIFLLTVPGGGASTTLDQLGESVAGGSTEQINTVLTAGDYYLVAVDYQGAPVAYDVCINTTGCTSFPSPPAPTRAAKQPSARAAPVRALAPRLSRRP